MTSRIGFISARFPSSVRAVDNTVEIDLRDGTEFVYHEATKICAVTRPEENTSVEVPAHLATFCPAILPPAHWLWLLGIATQVAERRAQENTEDDNSQPDS